MPWNLNEQKVPPTTKQKHNLTITFGTPFGALLGTFSALGGNKAQNSAKQLDPERYPESELNKCRFRHLREVPDMAKECERCQKSRFAGIDFQGSLGLILEAILGAF